MSSWIPGGVTREGYMTVIMNVSRAYSVSQEIGKYTTGLQY
jgi:hypothetical protein